ncbi:carboxypeptidase-like regulatory domain-containing protein [Flavobacterium nackdongense]|uniref:Carboxypeptidase-like regulatory domain-containing protein n=1 Tax=Flavobacterium nackdongense TaxID=2547394 RepID=A0A4P6Y9K9_9FLAO|nr:carboxypeptidase-like regulatory domain-containing protein [Flavobacterium nackdongense]QBN19676.1 carboxypeptidase-like regulatory domain-containing protein [Flavobacterium nackdongense]
MKNLLLFALVFVSLFSFAQTVKLEGTVSDTKNIALEMVNVMAVNQTTKAMDSYAITNDKGKYSLSLKPNTTYTVKISFLGMQSKEIEIQTTTIAISKNIALEESATELDGVEIIREMPVSIKGDTIVYNADSFKTGTERKLEDVLKKLPGVEVNADGEIEVEGKKVTKLMVEGKDFFDGDTKLGVKNIPADAIDKVQVLRNFNENSILKNVENNEENVAMNIKLKSGKKNFWFGDITGGIGVGHTDFRYVANPKLFYYSPKYSINLITNFNNIGELPLTVQDYFKLTGGFRGMMAKGGSVFNVSSNDLGISLLRNNRAKEIETKFGAANFSYNVNKAWNLSGFGIMSSSITDVETLSQTNFLKPNSSEIQSTENRKETAHQKSDLGMFKLSSLYKPSTNFQLDYDILTKISKQEEDSPLLRETIVKGISETELINTTKNQDPVSVNQNLSLFYTLNEKNIFAVETQHLYQEEDPFYNANLKSQPFKLVGYDENQNRNDISQNRFVKTSKIDAKIDYFYMLTAKSNINITLGNTFSDQNFNSNMYQILDDKTVNELDSQANTNDVSYKFNDAFIGLHYKILAGKFTFTPGVSFHSFNMTDTQRGSDYNQSFTRFLPDLLAIYQIKKAESLTYNFSYTNNFTDINQLAEGFVFSNYNSLRKGSRILENATNIQHSLRYFKYNMFNLENITAFLNYSKRIDAIKTAAIFDGVNQTSAPFNSDFADETISGNGTYGRSFLKNYKASLAANINWSLFNNRQNGINIANESFTQSYTMRASTNYKNMPNLELGYNIVINNYADNVFYTDKPFAKLDYYFLNAFSFVTEYEFYHYYNTDKTVNNEYDFLSASLIYQKKDSKFEYKISGTNLLNTKSINDDSFSQFSTRTSQYTVQPRYLIFSLKYNI